MEGEHVLDKEQESDLATFSFADLPWVPVDRTEKLYGHVTQEATVPISLGGKEYICTAWWLNIGPRTNKMVFFVSHNAKPGSENWLLTGGIAFHASNTSPDEVGTSITKNKLQPSSAELPRGVGVDFYNKMLDYIQTIANERQHQSHHIVSHDTSYGLNAEKWNAVFKPVLEQRGYTSTEPGLWERDYQPAKP